MLKQLFIQDFAVVQTTELSFDAGMTVLSGETGAGKSLIVDAIGFLSGQRADSSMVRHTAKRAELCAEFALTGEHSATAWLQANALDEVDGACILRRILFADGGSRAWINGRPVTLTQLGQFARQCVQIHGQQDQHSLLSLANQLQLLDSFGVNHAACAAVQTAHRQWNDIRMQQHALLRQLETPQMTELLRHQLDELQQHDLSANAVQDLQTRYKRQAGLANLIQACSQALDLLGGDNDTSVHLRLHQARTVLASVIDDDPQLTDVDRLLSDALIHVQEALSTLERLSLEVDSDATAMASLEERYTALHDLARKHRCSLFELAAQQEQLRQQYRMIEHADRHLDALTNQLEDKRRAWQEAAALLRSRRELAAQALNAQITQLMSELGMEGGQFCVTLLPSDDEQPRPSGSERCEFLVSANSGQPPRPLRKVASGGELARISLAIEVALMHTHAISTMVFDEVDTGIGGAIADMIGQKLRMLSQRRQVLCVTHLPQVAAKGHAHYRVHKIPVEGMTQSTVERLSPLARTEELARMLGGRHITAATRAAARQLLEHDQQDASIDQ